MWGDYLILPLSDGCWFRPRHDEGRITAGFWNISRESFFKEGIIQNIQQYLRALCKSLTSALLFVALCLSPRCLPVQRQGQGFVKDVHKLAFPNTEAERKVRMPKSWCKNRCRAALARPHRWHRCVCLLHGCVVNDEWFPLCLKACCHIPVNEATSYGLVGVMGLAWLQPHANSREPPREMDWAEMTFPNMSTTTTTAASLHPSCNYCYF